MTKLSSAIAGVAAGIALALAGVAYAQPCTGAGPGNGPGMGMGYGPGPMAGCGDGPGAGMGPGYGPMHGRGYGPGMGMGPGHGRMGGGDPAIAMESRLDDMKAQLKITAAQEPSWQAFTAAAKDQAASMKALRDEPPSAAATAPERMAERARHMQARANGMAKMATAFNALYSTLSTEQKAIADQHHGMGGPRARGRGPRAG